MAALRGETDRIGFLRSLSLPGHDAEDVLQDVFVDIARHRDRVARARKLKAYLFQMARNRAINRMRKDQRTQAVVAECAEWLEIDGETAADRGEAEALAIALTRLPEKQRTVIILKIYEEMTFAEIGKVLRISVNTAASRYRYGVERLRDMMGSDES